MRNYWEGADVWTGHRDYDKENVDGNYTIINYPAPHRIHTQGGRGNLIEPPPHTNLPTGSQRRVLAGGGRCQGPGTHNI